MHVSMDTIEDTASGIEVDDYCSTLNCDDQHSSIVQQIRFSLTEDTYAQCSFTKNVVIKAKYDRCGSDKSINTYSPMEKSSSNSHNEDNLDEPNIILWAQSKVSLGWSNSYPHGAGMTNVGNTCYLNSSLQALFHIPSLANWLLGEIESHVKSCENNYACIGFCSICAMMRTIHTTLSTSSNTIKPSLIHNKLKCIGKTLQYGRQEDAHEFIKLLLDHMQKSFILTCRAGKLDHRSKETTPLNQIFGGYLKQQVICPLCHYVSTTFSHFQDIVLDISTVSSVEGALRQFFQKETLDANNAYKCEKCKRRVSATKQHLIECVPNVLLLQLKRFSMNGNKIHKHIEIQEEINLSNYVNNKILQKKPQHSKYKLVSMVNHLGSTQHSGHYTAVARSSNGSMYEFDDNNVRYMSMENALRRNPYVLFYELIKIPKHTKIESNQVQCNNGFVNHKPIVDSLDYSKPGGSGLSMQKKDTVSMNGHSSPLDQVKHKRNKISFEIKNKSENNNTLLIDPRPSNTGLSNGDIRYLNGNNVETWDGRPSNNFESTNLDYSNKRSADDMYNEEFDTGKISKKKFKFNNTRRQDSPFQTFQNRLQNEGGHHRFNNNYGHKYKKHGQNHGIKIHQKRNFHSNKLYKSQGSYGNNYHRNNGYHNNKSWHHRNNYRGGNQGYTHYNRS